MVLAGHSLGGSVVTAYATWDFGGKPGAEGLSGLVYIDGGSSPTPISAEEAENKVHTLSEPNHSPWLAFGGIAVAALVCSRLTRFGARDFEPNSGIAEQTFATAAGKPAHPQLQRRTGQARPTKPPSATPSTSAPRRRTSPRPRCMPARGWSNRARANRTGWNRTGALTPIGRYARNARGSGVKGADGSEWYFPERLTIDTGAVGNGINNPAQGVLGEHAIHGTELPTSLHILAINSELDKLGGGSFTTLNFAEDLAEQSHIPAGNVTLINEEETYAHNDPNGAYPTNAFVEALVPFLKGV